MSVQSESTTEELRLLRARAYGPDADIADDPAALRRLHELEEQARPEVRDPAGPGPGTGPTAAGAPPAGAGDPGTDPATALGAGHDPQPAAGSAPDARSWGEDGSPSASGPPRANGADRPSTPESPDDEGGTAGDGSTGRRTRIALSAGSPAVAGSTGASDLGQTPSPQAEPVAGDAEGEAAGRPTPDRPWWRRTRTLWIASVLLAAIVASAVTVLVSQFPTGRVAVLRVDPDAEWPEDFFGPSEEGVMYEEFLGLSTLVAPQDWNQGQELDCLYVRAAEDDSGPSTGGCSSGFPPTAGLVVVLSSPEELRERFPVGTALQFVAEGSEVHVYAKPPPLTERTP